VNIFFNFLSSIGFGVYSDEKAKRRLKKQKKPRLREKPSRKSRWAASSSTI
jgi:beta-galactosidase